MTAADKNRPFSNVEPANTVPPKGDLSIAAAEEAPDMLAVREHVRRRYADAARRVRDTGKNEAGCCGGGCSSKNGDPITRDLYAADEIAALPADAVAASLGCGNPTLLAELRPGEIVLDLGSGGGLDVLLSARRVGPAGKAYGLDMTDEMLALARENQRKAGVPNAEFLKGAIENIPLPDNTVDVVISNCVINLSGDKDRVLREAFRVLKPGGRFAVSDVVVRKRLPDALRKDMELWAGCVAGALHEDEYRAKLAATGFAAVTVTPTRIYGRADVAEAIGGEGGGCCGEMEFQGVLEQADGALMSAFVRAVKP